jgi:hypothetical protein
MSEHETEHPVGGQPADQRTNEKPAERRTGEGATDRLRQFAAVYWKPVLSSFLAAVAGIPPFLKTLKALGLPVSDLPDAPVKWWLIVALAAGGFLLIRFPRVAALITKTIWGPPPPLSDPPRVFRGLRAYGGGDKLPARARDADDCWRLIQDQAFAILEGESGCGKSSLLNAVLLPKAREEFRVTECRVADDPFGKVLCALRREPYHRAKKGATKKALADAFAAAAQPAGAGVGDRPEQLQSLLLCLDQFEELFVTVRDEVRTRFLDVLSGALQGGGLRLLLVIRSDFTDLLLKACRAADPEQRALNPGNYYTLQAFRREQAVDALKEILTPLQGDDPLRKQRLVDFADALADELLRPPRDQRLSRDDEKTVLPVELQMVGMMAERLGEEALSRPALGRQGGKAGLLRAYLEDAKTYVLRKTGIPGDQTLLVLRQFISPAGTKWARSAASIGKDLGRPADQVEAVVKAFADKYLINLLPPEEGQAPEPGTSPRYELAHEHLVQVLIEAPEPVLQQARDAEERLLFWMSRTRAASTVQATGRPPCSPGQVTTSPNRSR